MCYRSTLQVLGWRRRADCSYSTGRLGLRRGERCLLYGWRLWFLNEDDLTWVDGPVVVGNRARRHSHTVDTRHTNQKKDGYGFSVHRKHYMKYEGSWVKEVKSFQRQAHIKEKIGFGWGKKVVFFLKTGAIKRMLWQVLVFVRFSSFLQNYSLYLLTILFINRFANFKSIWLPFPKSSSFNPYFLPPSFIPYFIS